MPVRVLVAQLRRAQIAAVSGKPAAISNFFVG